MPEDQAPKYTVSIGLPPTAQFAKGAMLVVRDDTVTGLISALGDVLEDDGLAKSFVQDAFKKEVTATVSGAPAPTPAAAPTPPASKPSGGKPWESRSSGPAPSNGKASEAQVKMLFGIIGDLGWSIDDGAEFIGQQLGREDTPRLKDLSKGEASKAIDALRTFQNSQ